MNRKYIIDTDENKRFMNELTGDLLRFGHRFPAPTGSSYYLGDDGTPWTDRPRETWITCRMAHVYSIGAILGHEGSEDLVDQALKGIKGELHDDVNGGWYPGIVYTTDWEGRPVVHDRMHWTLAEAINTSAVLYRVSGETFYADMYASFMEYLDDKVIDHVNGSWYHQLDQNNRPIATVWPGKSDIYHALQATLIPYCDISVSVAVAAMRMRG